MADHPRRVAGAIMASTTIGVLLALGPAPAQQPGGNETLTVTAQFTRAAEDEPARLYVTAKIDDGWHVYSLTQPKGGPLPSKIKLTKSDDFRLTGEFKSHPKAETHTDPEIWPDVELQTHAGKVTWYAPIELAPGVDPAKLTIRGKLNVQACNDRGCLPPKDYPFAAALGEPVRLAVEKPTK